MTGYSSGDFGVGNPIIRQDMCVALDNYQESLFHTMSAGAPPEVGLIDWFPDVYQVSIYAREAMYHMYIHGVIQGVGIDVKLLDPYGKVTRGMAAVILQRYLEAYEDEYLIHGYKDLLL